MPEWRAMVTTVGTSGRAVSGQAHLRMAHRGEFAVESEYLADSSSPCDHNPHRVSEGICTFIVSAIPMTGLVLDARVTSRSTATQGLPLTRPNAPAASSYQAFRLNASKSSRLLAWRSAPSASPSSRYDLPRRGVGRAVTPERRGSPTRNQSVCTAVCGNLNRYVPNIGRAWEYSGPSTKLAIEALT